MKRGVPPTARNARTGELTPPGITRWARSNSAWLRSAIGGPSSVNATLRRLALAFGRLRVRIGGWRIGRLAGLLLRRRQCPEEAVGDHAAHAGAEAGIEALVHERERLADGRLKLVASGQQRGQRG